MAHQEHPQIELTIIAAQGLKNVSLLRGKMNPFVVAFVDPYSKLSTRILHRSGEDPVWNDSLHIPVSARLLADPAAALTIQVFHYGPLNTALAGATHLLLHDLLRHAALKGNGEGDIITVQLFRPSGRPHGIIRVFLKLSGDGLPGLPGLLGDDLDVDGCNVPVTGIPLMAMGLHNVASADPEHQPEKHSYHYPPPTYVHMAYLPYPTAPSPRPSRNSNFVFGLVSGAAAAVLLGCLF